MDKVLSKLIDCFSVSGNEDGLNKIIKEELKDIKCDIKEDKMRNLIVKVGKGSEKVMVCANMDSIGFITTHIENNGLIFVRKIGEFKDEYVINGFVKFKNGTIGKLCKYNKQLFIDIGLNNKEKVEEKINIGDTACIIGPYLRVGEKNIMSPSLNNKIGCYILIELIKKSANANKEIYFVFSTEEELGGRGARAAAYGIDPDYCIILGMEKGKDIGSEGNVLLGEGPALKIMDRSLIIHEDIKKMIEKTSQKLGIKIQHIISTGNSQGGLVHKERAGIKTGELSIPCRYVHSTSEMVCIDDVENTINLLAEIL